MINDRLLFKPIDLETERLCLEAWSVDMARDMLTLAEHPSVLDADWKICKTLKQAERRIIKLLKDGGQRLEWAVISKEHMRVIGSIGISSVRLKGFAVSMSVGYVIADAYWGNGYCTEAVKRVIDYVFKGLNIDVLCVQHYVYNTRSERVIQKCGFRHYGTYPLSKPHAPKSKACYKLTKEEYKRTNE